MAGRIFSLAELTSPELDELKRETTIGVAVISPLEVHGPHLPLGTDVFVAEEVRERAVRRCREARPELDFLYLPSYFLGSDTIPTSPAFDSRAVNLALLGAGRFLASRGFRYLWVFDNHGGPRHQVAVAKAVRRLWRERSFCLVAPFLSFYRRMVEDDPRLLEEIGAVPGTCGDAQDCHAGLNETSLMLAARPEAVRPAWSRLPRVSIKEQRWPSLAMGTLAAAAERLGAPGLGADLRYLGLMLNWTTERRPSTYIGEPRAASAEAGERMLDAFTGEALARLEDCLRGEPPFFQPLAWSLRFLERSR